MKYIFIVGCAKTGSKLLRRILMTHPDLNLLDELHFLVPRWVKKDFVHHARAFAPLTDSDNLHRLIEFMYADRLEGAFWRVGQSKGIAALPGRIDDIHQPELSTTQRGRK